MVIVLIVKLRNRSNYRMTPSQNIVGPQIRRFRSQKGWTQEVLAARCTVRGLDLSRGTLSKIEAQLRCVTDQELVVIADALGVSLQGLFPIRAAATKPPEAL